ncbi:MAG: heme-binding protein [Azospirillaceae bacterium]
MRPVVGILAALAALVLAGCSVVGVRSGTEEPRYSVVERVRGVEGVEIRRYAPRLAAETVVAGGEEEARNVGFRRLAGYIFGDNRASETIAMTAPVAQEAVGSEKIAMTAPVAQEPAPGDAGGWVIRFFMPAEYTAETLPVPTDPQVAIVEVPDETVAVRKFSGSRSPQAVAREAQILRDALDGSGWRAEGPAVAWFYDPPWTLPFLRRNEVAIPVAADDDAAAPAEGRDPAEEGEDPS